jgi:hypothetical protein
MDIHDDQGRACNFVRFRVLLIARILKINNVPLNYWYFKIWCSNVLSKRRRFFSSDFAA